VASGLAPRLQHSLGWPDRVNRARGKSEMKKTPIKKASKIETVKPLTGLGNKTKISIVPLKRP
jgi:hypothetical protein